MGDVAYGQLVSDRLRTLPPSPPDVHLHAVYPTTRLPLPLTYRRTAVLVTPTADGAAAGRRPYLVLADSHTGYWTAARTPRVPPVPAAASLVFHQQDGRVADPVPGSGGAGYDMGNGTVFIFAADTGTHARVPLEFALDRWEWDNEGGERATRLRAGPAAPPAAAGAQPAAAAVPPPPSAFVTVVYPAGSTMPCGPGGAAPLAPTVTAVVGELNTRTAVTVTLDWVDGSPPESVSFGDNVIDATMSPTTWPPEAAPVWLGRGGVNTTLLAAVDVVETASQGDVGMSVLSSLDDVGEAPAWLVRQRDEWQAGVEGIMQPAIWPWPPGGYAPMAAAASAARESGRHARGAGG